MVIFSNIETSIDVFRFNNVVHYLWGYLVFLHVLKQTHRCGTNNHSKWQLDFVLSPRPDPIGDQNGVRHNVFTRY